MRSIPFTLLLLVVTAGLSIAAVMRLKEGNLSRFFGPPTIAIGEYLYRFEPKDIHRIHLAGNGVKAECVFEKGQWRMVKPWNDRMDPRAANAILQFTLSTEVTDIIPKGKLDTAKAGLREGTIGIRIENRRDERLATYLLGRKTAWIHRDSETKEETPTVFIQPQDEQSEDYTYVCTGDIHPLFKDGFRHLRDHHPFLFNPTAIESIRLQGSEGELLLSRADVKSPWRIAKPLELRTDPAAVKKLIEDLFHLRALKIAERADVTLPAEDGAKEHQKIAIKHFNQLEEVTLEIFQPATAAANTTFATISDRPGIVFELPLKPIAADVVENKPGTPAVDYSIVSLAGLPDTVNELRNAMLTNIDIDSLQSIHISPRTSGEIFITREKDQAWQFSDGDGMRPLNELALFRLLKALTQAKVAGFATDAAVNLTPYGLDRPLLSLRFSSFGKEKFTLIFGQSTDGTWHAMRTGIPTVVKLDATFIREISIYPWQWRHTAIWSIPPVDLFGIQRIMEGRPSLDLEYSLTSATWRASEGGIDRNAELATNRAERLVKLLTELQCETWLAPDDTAAIAALAKPALSYILLVKAYDDQANYTGITRRVLHIAPASDRPDNATFYARIDQKSAPFLLGRETLLRLAVDLFGDD
jgi:hypothetical protein